MKSSWWLSIAVVIVLLAAVLRLVALDATPPSLYWEEAALGYDAYSILLTGKDHHGNPWPVVAFESFGDWKPALYFYTAVPSIALLGLNEWGVRVPSAMAGIGIVLAVGWMLAELRTTQRLPHRLVLIGMVVTAISPWAIQFSRGAWEANMATFLIALGMASGLRWLRLSRRSTYSEWWLLPTMTLLILSMYTYHSARIVAPLLGMVLVGWRFFGDKLSQIFKHMSKVKWQWLLMIVVAVAIALPLLNSLRNPTFSQRFNETNIFADLQVLQESVSLQEASGNTIWAKLLYHRYVWYARAVSLNALTHLRFDFLFLSGDSNPRHSTGFVGLFYIMEILPLLVGLVVRWQAPKGSKAFVMIWISIAIAITALTKATPHSLRILVSLPAWIMLITFGWESIWNFVERRGRYVSAVVVLGIVGLYVTSFAQYWRYYTKVYPVVAAHDWQYGYREMITAVRALQEKYPSQPVLVSRGEGRPAMYYWFMNAVDPRRVQEANLTVAKDQGEYLQFEQVSFVDHPFSQATQSAVVALTTSEFAEATHLKDKTTVMTPTGEPVWVVGLKE